MARLSLTPRRAPTVLLVLLILLLTIPAVGAQGPVYDAQVVTGYLNMRISPDSGAAVVQQLTNGTLLTAQGRNADGSWLYVSTAENVSGWANTPWLALRNDLNVMALPVTAQEAVAPDPIAPAPAAPADSAAVPAPASGGVAASVMTSVNVRTGPTTDYRRLVTLPVGTQLTLQGRDVGSAWVYGTSNTGATGWLAAEFTSADLATVNSLPVMDANAPTGVSAAPAAAAPAAQPAAPAASVVSTTATGGFMLGGQVADFTQDSWMHQAGMTWVKRQVTYHNGESASNHYNLIQDAHNRGFRILVSVKGHPNELASDPNYINNFAGFLGGLAAGGADGIEVWNEVNIDREWPIGRIDPNWYAQMLQAAYNAIKGNNPNTIVISGAPAPTGAEGAFGTDRVWNDDRYMRGLAAAGAANYMDCIGIHYNEGIIGPSQRSGDPRAEYYSRYFWGMVDTYYNAFGGARPLCFTEIGYLSGEGYGPLPGGFAWASNVSVDQQAQWLAEAARLARDSGKVKLFIVWNVDFTGKWGDDPQGGFAIVRPNGDCPACRTLAAIQ